MATSRRRLTGDYSKEARGTSLWMPHDNDKRTSRRRTYLWAVLFGILERVRQPPQGVRVGVCDRGGQRWWVTALRTLAPSFSLEPHSCVQHLNQVSHPLVGQKWNKEY